jgi:hypothetical protein
LLLGFAAIPALKPLVLRPGERFDFADASILFPSAVLILMITTVLFLGWGSSNRLGSTAEQGLAQFSSATERRFVDELRRARDELRAMDGEFAAYLKS